MCQPTVEVIVSILRHCCATATLLFAAVTATACGYNAVVERDEDVKAAWAEVQNQYQRRADLIPNLVASVTGATDFEKEALQRVVEARAKATGIQVSPDTLNDPAAFKRFEAAQNELSGALSRLLVVVERYPDLKASEAFRDLMAQLEGTENRIAVARRRYVEAVAEYNKVVLRFPSLIGAKLRGMDVRPTFEAPSPNVDQAPAVKF
jgi:LemA protein